MLISFFSPFYRTMCHWTNAMLCIICTDMNKTTDLHAIQPINSQLWCNPSRECYRESIFSPSSGQICKFNDSGKVCVIRLLYRLHGDPAKHILTDPEKIETHVHAGNCPPTVLRLCSREHHAGEKLLCLPQESATEVCVFLYSNATL